MCSSDLTDLLLNNFTNIPDRGIAFWYTLRNFDEDLYSELFSKYKFRNVLFPIGKTIPWDNSLFGPTPGFKYAEGEDGSWYLPVSDWYLNGMVSWNIDIWKHFYNNFKKSTYKFPDTYNTFFIKNSWKSRNYSSKNIDDILVGDDRISNPTDRFAYLDYSFYNEVVDFHIKNEINLVIINDLVGFPVVENKYISYLDMVGFLDVRLLITCINQSKNFISICTSPMDLATYYCDTNLVYLNDPCNAGGFVEDIQKIKNKKFTKFNTKNTDRTDLDNLFFSIKNNS